MSSSYDVELAGALRYGSCPPAVKNAVRLMIAGAVADLVAIVVLLAGWSPLHDRLRRAYPGYSSHRLDALFRTEVITGIAIYLVAAAVAVVLARRVRAGANWARIVTWVVAGLGLLAVLRSLASTDAPLSRVVSLLIGIIDLAIIVLLAQGASNNYFKPRPY